MTIPLSDQIDCIEREVRFRRRVYPRHVSHGKMTAEIAKREVDRLQAVLETLHKLAREHGLEVNRGRVSWDEWR